MSKTNNHAYTRPYWLILLLSTMASWTPVHATTPHSATVPTMQGTTRKLDLTTQEEELLSTYLRAPSDQAQLLKLIEALCHTKASVRDAAIKAISQILTANPGLANKEALSAFQKTLKKGHKNNDAKQSVKFLELCIEADPGLVLAVTDILLHSVKTSPATAHFSHEIRHLCKKMIEGDPTCLQRILAVAKKTAAAPKAAIRLRTFELLHWLAVIQELEFYPQALAEIFKLAVHALKDESAELRCVAMMTLGLLSRKDAKYAKDTYAIAVEATQDISWEVRWGALIALDYLAEVNSQYRESVYLIVFQNSTSKVWGIRRAAFGLLQRAAQIGVCARQIFPKAVKAVTHDKIHFVRKEALYALACTLKADAQYAQELLPVALQAAKDDDNEVRQEALSTLRAIIKADKKYASPILTIVLTSIESDTENRVEALKTLDDILKAQPSHAKSRNVRKALETASYDSRQEVREQATALMSTHGIE